MAHPILLRMACAYWTANRERLANQFGMTSMKPWDELEEAVQGQVVEAIRAAANEMLDSMKRIAAPGQPEHFVSDVRDMVND